MKYNFITSAFGWLIKTIINRDDVGRTIDVKI